LDAKIVWFLDDDDDDDDDDDVDADATAVGSICCEVV